jgi:hypothetical protein
LAAGKAMQDLHDSSQIIRASELARARGSVSYEGPNMNQAWGPSAREWLPRSGFRVELVMTSGSYADQQEPDYFLMRIRPYSVRLS